MRVSPEIESLIPYKPGQSIEQVKRELGLDDVIKLASNENPLGPSPKVVSAIVKACSSTDILSRYPDPSFFRLRQKLSELWGVREDDLLFGNGSNELIDLLIRVFCEPGDKIIFPEKSFFAYAICAQGARVGKREIPVDENFKWDIQYFLEDFEKTPNPREKILFIDNPGNPTGSYLNTTEVGDLLSVLGGREDILVVFDEAYLGFERAEDFAHSIDFFKKYSNVIVFRTFSKVFGLAGLRLGVMIGDRKHLQWVHRVRQAFNVNSLTQEAALSALDDLDYQKSSRQIVWQGLDDFYDFFTRQKIPFLKSQGNFILFDSLRSGELVFSMARQKGLLIRPMSGYNLLRHLRISMGSLEENKRAMDILEDVFKEIPPL